MSVSKEELAKARELAEQEKSCGMKVSFSPAFILRILDHVEDKEREILQAHVLVEDLKNEIQFLQLLGSSYRKEIIDLKKELGVFK